MSVELWLALLSAAILISLSPGAGAATAMSYGLNHGVRGAAPAVAGLIAGYGTQLLIVAVGLGSLVAASPALFVGIKWVGAGYLIWLGISLWRSKGALAAGTGTRKRLRQRFISAYLVNITNPKGMVFLVALVPQFMDPALPQGPQLLVIAATLLFVDWSVMTGYSGLASRLRALMQSPKAVRLQNRLSGSALIVAGLVLSTATH
ncbi:Homoserine/homoserine lactone efflux protein [Marinobacterium lacunae]|uniref:Homoserine/homoserine lactone efflux protein n=1 Tax=Marinobacterium lacunae TaxID=1232683 RepID=A0A081G443_9GAMM|nr:LysE family transporter [Marinobacterium lacunae]KEA65548.1 Homoserine/homoserine lactone efflux protein [Marinobacterium lacunae]